MFKFRKKREKGHEYNLTYDNLAVPEIHTHEPEDAADEDRPQFAWVVAPEMCAANEAADDGGESCQDGCNQAQGEGDAQLVESV